MNNDCGQKRPQFGTRFLTDQSKVFEQNAWYELIKDIVVKMDDVKWDQTFIDSVETKIKQNSESKVSSEKKEDFEKNANHFWDKFYDKHENKFFKDRHWLFTEFPELKPSDDTSSMTVLELGCGVGNTVFPVLQINSNPNLFVYCCDFSSTAIDLLKENPLYDPKRCNAFVMDLTCDEWTVPFTESSLDIVTMIFVLSAIDPIRMQDIINRIHRYLKPGGLLLFRDYGRYDMTQVRFKAGHCIEDNFYVRGDGTRAYFFTEEQVDQLMTNAGLNKCELRTDKRLQVNRAKRITMYRVWVEAKYRKPN